MPFTVFHYTGADRFKLFSAEAFEDGLTGAFTQVATVEAGTLDEAYALTQHLARPWTDGARVTLTPEDAAKLAIARAASPEINSSVFLRIRSTSVGDILVDSDGVAHGVAAVGFERIEAG
jgi:hypothetical protein